MKIMVGFFVIVILFSITGFSQEKQETIIKGRVVNKNTKEYLSHMNIYVKGTTIGTISDAKGNFVLKNLPLGQHTIVATGVGFKASEQIVELKHPGTVEVNFELEEDLVQLGGVVVSASRNETSRKEAPTLVSIITPKVFESTNSVCLAQSLSYQPGLRVETNCQNCGFQQVRINGLEGQYSQILIDSRPIFSALASVYGIEQIPVNMIERVEVVRGGGSALFGSNAIAGTINIITKEPTTNSVTVANTTTFIDGQKPDVNTFVNASVLSDDNKAGVIIFGSTRQRKPYDANADGFSEISLLNGKNIGFRSFYKPTVRSKLTVEYHNLSEFRRGGNHFDLPPHETDITEQTDHNINTGGLKYDVFLKNYKHRLSIYSSVQKIVRKSYYGAQKDPNAYGLTQDLTYVSGMQITHSFDTLFFMPAEFTIGSEYFEDAMLDKMLGYGRIIDQKVSSSSLFLQNEWKTSKMSILAGARLDKHNLIKQPIVSPRFNFRYNLSDFLILRSSLASGFRAPQAFDEDLHVTAVGGNVVLIQLDPNLKTERSYSLTASADFYKTFGQVQTNLLIEGFYTTLDNVFVLEEIGSDSSGNIIMERRNGSGAVVQGVNIEAKIIPSENLQVQLGFTLQKSEYKEPQRWSDNESLSPQKSMFRSPNHYGYFNLTYDPTKNLNISLTGTYTGSMLVQHFKGYIPDDTEKQTPPFYVLNLKVSYDFVLSSGTTLQLNGGCHNIFNSYQTDFDKGEFRDSGYIYGPDLPRSFFLGVKLSI